MKLILEQNEAAFELPQQGALLIGNDEDCQVQINRPEIWGRHAAIHVDDYGYVLKVESSPITVNGTTIESSCMLYAGDELKLAGLTLFLVDDNYIPKAVNQAGQFESEDCSEELSSVFGLRCLNSSQNGAFVKSNYHHPDGWHIFRTDAKLALIANNQAVFVNGQQVESAWLKNGDQVHYNNERFNVECPGHSGYSKFSPSHPRNVMLSESLREAETPESPKNSLRPHYWWLTLLLGLIVLVLVIWLL
mgnify:CR=1 FL=1